MTAGDDQRLQTWAAGLPLAGHRSLSAEEIARVSALRGRVLRQGLRWSLAGPGLFGLCLLGFFFGPTFEARWTFFAGGFFGALLVVTPLWGRPGVERLRLAARLRRDLLDGRVLQFRLPEPPVSVDPDEPDSEELDEPESLEADEDEVEQAPAFLEVLPHAQVCLGRKDIGSFRTTWSK